MLARLKQDDNRERRAQSYAVRPLDDVGTPPQRTLQQRAHDLWRSVNGDPRYAYEGRLVTIDGADDGTIDQLNFLLRGQGIALSWHVSRADEITLTEHFKSGGFAIDRWDHWHGGDDAVHAAERMRGACDLPAGYAIKAIAPDTSDAVIADVAGFAAAHGVMVPAAHVMRGVTRRCVIRYATAPDGAIAAVAGSVLGHHRDSEFADAAWWGMLCTHPEHRGRGLSKILGAITILEMAERYGATSFYTGVRSENLVSQVVCNNLGVRRTDDAVLMVVSPALSAAGPVTS